MSTSTDRNPTVEASEFCQMQPSGWFCTRRAGHDGACSAHRHLPDGDLDSVVEANRELLRTRSAVGIQKYGMTLADASLSLPELLTHLLEELLDGANYAQAGLQRAKAAESLLLQDGERYRVDAMRVLRRCIEDEKRGWTGQEQKAVHYALESLLDRFRVQVERGAIPSPAGQDAKAEPLTAERIDWLANCACADGVAYPHNVKVAINSALKESGPTISVQQKISEPIGYISRGAIEHALSQGIGASTYISAAQTDEFPVAIYPAPQAAAEGVGSKFVRVPMVPNRAMREVMNEEGWTWEDLLAAAEVITEDEYAAIAAAPERAAIPPAGEADDGNSFFMDPYHAPAAPSSEASAPVWTQEMIDQSRAEGAALGDKLQKKPLADAPERSGKLADDDVLQELANNVLHTEQEGDEGDYTNAVHAFQIAATPGKVLELLARPAAHSSNAAPSDDLVSACRALIAYVDKNPPMADSVWCVQQIRAALAAPAPTGESLSVPKACRNQLIGSGQVAIPKSCPRCAHSKYCVVDGNEQGTPAAGGTRHD